MSGKIIVALDGMDPRAAKAMAERLSSIESPALWGFKGNDLLLEIGSSMVGLLKSESKGLGVFVDPKLHDIPKTVENSVNKLVMAGADLITVHAAGTIEMLKAAVRGTEDTDALILGVTVLTNETQADLDREYGVGNMTIARLVRLRAEKAVEAGLWGIVCAPADLSVVSDLPIRKVSPNIRLDKSGTPDDQNRDRQATPEEAIELGADLIVIGRPITKAEPPALTLRAISQRLGLEAPLRDSG